MDNYTELKRHQIFSWKISSIQAIASDNLQSQLNLKVLIKNCGKVSFKGEKRNMQTIFQMCIRFCVNTAVLRESYGWRLWLSKECLYVSCLKDILQRFYNHDLIE